MSTDTYLCFDASAQVPTVTPHGCHAVLGYLNSKEAADPWPVANWLPFHDLRQFPAWVAELWAGRTVEESAAAQAELAVAQAAALGWRKGRIIVCDMEALRDLRFWRHWAARVTQLGYRPCWYGSGDAAPPASEADLRWLADPDGIAEIPYGYQAKQFLWGVDVPGGVVDLSVIADEIYRHGGVGPRHHPGPAASLKAGAIRLRMPFEIRRATTTTGGTTVSLTDKIKDLIESHRDEIEALADDGLKAAEAAVIPAEVMNALGSAANVLTSFLDSKRDSLSSNSNQDGGELSTPAPAVPDLPSIPAQPGASPAS